MQHHNLNFKTFSITTLLLCNYLNVFAQEILWEKSLGGKHAEYLLDTQPTFDFGFIIAGSSVSNNTGNKSEKNNGNLDYWLWKMNEDGKMDWQQTIGGSGNDLLNSVKNTYDGGFILAGTSDSNALSAKESKDFGRSGYKKDNCKGVTDFWVVKLDANGNGQWQKTIGGTGQEELVAVIQTRDGGYMLGGSSSSSAPQPPPKEGEQGYRGNR